MLRAEVIKRTSTEMPEIRRLMDSSFPRRERMSMRLLLGKEHGSQEFLAFYDGDKFCGFASVLSWRDLSHILYFAIEENLRDHHYGSMALQLLAERYPHHRLLADLEKENDEAPNAMQRRIRRSFYERNGFRASAVEYAWHGELYRIFVRGGDLTREEYDAFWDQFEDEK